MRLIICYLVGGLINTVPRLIQPEVSHICHEVVLLSSLHKAEQLVYSTVEVSCIMAVEVRC